MPPRDADESPACYALVLPGLEAVASDEASRDLGAAVRKTERGLVVFRPKSVGPELLKLRTTEDVFLLAWGTDDLSYRATDLPAIGKWSRSQADWQKLFNLQGQIRGRTKGRPTYRVVAQMQGERGYRRVDAGEQVAAALAAKLPPAWTRVAEDAAVEVWLTIIGKSAVCGVRLSDKTMRHRTYKDEHLPASLRPTLAAAMARLAGAGPGQTVIDPMCGAGTIVAESIELSKMRKAGFIRVMGGDLEATSVEAARVNLRRVGPALLCRWDSRRLPLPDASVDRVVCNPPFGKQLSSPEEVGPLYKAAAREWDRVLVPGGRAVLLVSEYDDLNEAVRPYGWTPRARHRVDVLGQGAGISVWQKPELGGTTAQTQAEA